MGLLWWTKLLLVFATLGLSSVATELRAASNVTTANDGICQSIDIRSNINAFEKLRGCRVIEGNLHILLISQLDERYYNNITFPELREITGFFLLYRVDGLKTLSRMFPNLAVIRGQKLLFNHAFAIYEMRGLTDIGLVSLTHIVRGAVHISKNPNLCYANTIDWDRIAKQGKEDNYIAQNKADNECLLCPGDDKKTSETESHQSECPMMPHSPGRHLCWNTNKTSCQKICPDGCEACNSKGECCSDMCLSGCADDNKNDCFVCRYMSMGPRCVQHCPHNTVLFMDRRCVSEDDCRKIPKPKELDISNMYPHKPFAGMCVLDCPPNYSEEKVNKQWECNECKGTCPKKCQARKVDSIYAAQMLRGCTYIEGPLEIQIVGGGRNIVKELHDNLKEITEIEGYLKVTRSYPLVSLTFLKNLQVIHGTPLESNKFSVVVLDNPNLEDLFDFNLTRVHVRTGRLFFHFNPKLCFDKIEQFRIYAKMNETSGTEVDRKSNGEKTACNVTLLDVYVEIKSDVSVVLSWKPFRMDEYRHLLGYVIYVRDSPKQNLSLYDSRDACGTDGWQVYDYRNGNEEAVDFLYYPLTLLKPYTQYAFYVKTYTISTEQTGAQSKIQYFRTYPGKPTQVLNLRVHSNFSNELVINWQPPLKPNGNLTKYRITVKLEPDDPNFLEQRNYCREPLIAVKQPEVVPNKVTTSTKSDDIDVCPCRDEGEKSEPKFAEKDALSHMTFEDQLHNLVYVKRYDPSSTRQKRDVLETTVSPDVTEPPSTTNSDENIYYSSPNETVYVIRELQHFSEYTVTVQACRESISTNESAKNCSDESIYNARTLPKPNADDIKSFRMAVQKLNQSLRLEWDEPTSPNGLILTYQIEYTRLNIENSKPTVICITRKAYVDAGKVYVLKNLASGNYSLRLMATSLNGNGAHTDYQYFYIEAEGSSHVFEIVFGGIAGFVILVGFVLGYIYWLRGGFQRDVPNMKLIASVNPEYVSTAYVPDEWEVPRKKIELVRELGQGSFGMVYEGIARDVVKGYPEMRCAIKTVNEHATDRERVEFLNEASVMKAFDTGHVVRLLGVVSQGQPTLVVMELMSNGDLKSYLRSHRPEEQDSLKRESPPSLKRILQMAIEIADGMAYLTAKKFVHRDLAARNCMVSDNLTVKIGDFGMTRDIYETDYYRKGTKGLLPVRWMAPESLKDGVFTSSSDVWSYGVVLWEMATLASQPYQGLSNDQVLRYVIDGGVMERPENCPDKLYDLMRLCWQHKPSIRPSFLELEGTLLSESHDEFRKVAFYFSKSGEEARQAAQVGQQQDEAEVTTPLRPTRPDDDDFDLDSCSDGHDETDDDAALTEGRRVSFQTPQYRTAAYRDAAGPSLLPSPPQANGYVSSRPGNNGTGNVEMTEC